MKKELSTFDFDGSIAIVGLGYVGLPLALEFSKKFQTIGFDINSKRIEELAQGVDSTGEFEVAEIKSHKSLTVTNNIHEIKECNVYIVTVPTPVDKNNQPNFEPLINASEAIGGVLKKGDIVIYESTVYPGATQEICVPALERQSGLIFNSDFFVGYSPERINPGDKKRRLKDITKITSGSTKYCADFVDQLYRAIVIAGTHKCSSIKIAEASKIIENTQRDVNIAVMNEFSKIFERLNINTAEVIAAASTKWNFLPFTPGLVGGHCIGIDPYYLIQKAQSVGYSPEILSACRKINDSMGEYIASRIIKLLIKKNIKVSGAKLLLLGVTFKEDCRDIRNSRVIGLIRELQEYCIEVTVVDPLANQAEVLSEYGIRIENNITYSEKKYDGLIAAVAHREFLDMGFEGFNNLLHVNSVIFDIKGMFPPKCVSDSL
jgi:UDP-N-acetyl-D-galactosamine dehydrogenase